MSGRKGGNDVELGDRAHHVLSIPDRMQPGPLEWSTGVGPPARATRVAARIRVTEHRDERVDHPRVELRPAFMGHPFERRFCSHTPAVRPVERHCDEGVTDSDHPTRERYLAAPLAVRVATPVPPLMVSTDGRGDSGDGGKPLEHFGAEGRMAVDERPVLR